MSFLYWLENIRIPVLDELMLLITMLGEETAFLVAALIVFWCVDKRRGYFILSVGLVGNIVSQFMKLWYRIPRPWELGKNFTITEQAGAAADGYSFPSGHSQSAVGVFGALGYRQKALWLRIVCIAIVLLVPFSRMYLGVHTPADVLIGSMLSLWLIVILHPFVMGKHKNRFPWVLGIMLVLAVGYLAFVELYTFPADVDVDNLTSGVKNAYTFLGCVIGLIIVYAVDSKWLNFSEKAVWWAQLLKILGGLAVVLAVREGMRAPLDALFDGHLASRAVRYGLIVLVAGIVWPLSFRFFSRLGAPKEASEK